MFELAKFQTTFLKAVMQDSLGNNSGFQFQLNNTSRLVSNYQIDIYSNGIHNGLINALAEIYPVCSQLVGESLFNQLAYQHTQKYKSNSADLAQYGTFFSEFITKTGILSDVPYLADICVLELAYHKAFHASDRPVINLQNLQNISQEQLLEDGISLSPGHSLIKTNYPIDTIWQAHQNSEIEGLVIEHSELNLYLYRKGYDIHIDRLTSAEWDFLMSLQSGFSLTNALTNINTHKKSTDILAKSLINNWVTIP